MRDVAGAPELARRDDGTRIDGFPYECMASAAWVESGWSFPVIDLL
jgi:hypothetical protein